MFSLRFDQMQNSFHTIVKNLNQFEEITYLLTEFLRRGKYKGSSLPWPTFVHKNVVFLKLCMPLFNKIIIEKEKEVLIINLSKKWLWTNHCHRLKYRFWTDGNAKWKVRKMCIELLLLW